MPRLLLLLLLLLITLLLRWYVWAGHVKNLTTAAFISAAAIAVLTQRFVKPCFHAAHPLPFLLV
jgi:hypothetical protein